MQINQSEYQQFIKPIENQMMSAVWRILRNAEDTQDAFQDALLILLKKWKLIRKHPNPRALILRICINSAYDFLRKRHRQPVPDSLESVAGTVSEDTESAFEKIVQSETQTLLLEKVNQLPQNQKISIHMRYIEGFSYPEIAQALGCGEASVRKHVSRALTQLHEQLSEKRITLLNSN